MCVWMHGRKVGLSVHKNNSLELGACCLRGEFNDLGSTLFSHTQHGKWSGKKRKKKGTRGMKMN